MSRAIAGKYIATSHGVFDMKFFFSHGVKTESGDDLSNTSVKNTIADLIKGEPKHKPLSDDNSPSSSTSKASKWQGAPSRSTARPWGFCRAICGSRFLEVERRTDTGRKQIQLLEIFE